MVALQEIAAEQLVPGPIAELREQVIRAVDAGKHVGEQTRIPPVRTGTRLTRRVIFVPGLEHDDLGLSILSPAIRMFHGIGSQLVVAVGEHDIAPLRGVHTFVACGAGTGVLLNDEAESLVSDGSVGNLVDAAVRRSVVDEDGFEIIERLIENGIDKGIDRPLGIVKRNNERDLRLAHRHHVSKISRGSNYFRRSQL